MRLIVGGAVNVILLLMVPRLGVWSSDEREFRLALLASCLGTVGVVASCRFCGVGTAGNVAWPCC